MLNDWARYCCRLGQIDLLVVHEEASIDMRGVEP